MLRLGFVACAVACSSTSSRGPVARSLEAAAIEAGVPADLVEAIAVEEDGLRFASMRPIDPSDHIAFGGRLGLRHGKLDTLALGAALVGASEDALRIDTELATRAGASVLAQLGATANVATWRPALEQLSGMDDRMAHDYASRVLAILHGGGRFPARGGETIAIAAHPEIPAADTAIAIANAPDAADYPGAQWITTSCTDKCTPGRPLGNASVDTIVIHDTEASWDISVATLQNDSGKSVHYIIDADGSRVGQFRPETDTTWHAGNFYYNEKSIGIEHVGMAGDPAGYSPALYATSRALVQNIRTRWNVPLDRTHIIGHYQIPDGDRIAEDSPPCGDKLATCESSADYGGRDNHNDPGLNWQWCQYMEHLGGSCTCNDAWELWNCTTDGTEAVRCKDGVVEIAQCANGCDVQPIGVDDICHVADGGGTMPDAGVGSDPSGGTTAPVHASGGCAAGHGGGMVIAIALLFVRRRRARRGR